MTAEVSAAASGEDALAPFDFALPEERIALRPVHPRDMARLLQVCTDDRLVDRQVRELPQLLRPDDLLVVNDTRVIAAALSAERAARDTEQSTPLRVGLNLARRIGPDGWLAYARPGKRLRVGDDLQFGGEVAARIEQKFQDGRIALRFNRIGTALDAALEARGAPPLPPYIARRRAVDDQDKADYQTLFAQEPGSVAAPTAGLHFTPELMAQLEARGVRVAAVTLHVGPGTFAPLTADHLARNTLHAEYYEVSEETANAIAQTRARGGRVIAVGTTSLRTLESAADGAGGVRAEGRETELFIRPGYQFGVVDRLMTNFHLPRSSLFMLVCAFSGTARMQAAYAHAISAGYRFYSYGDACLLDRAEGAGVTV